MMPLCIFALNRGQDYLAYFCTEAQGAQVELSVRCRLEGQQSEAHVHTADLTVKLTATEAELKQGTIPSLDSLSTACVSGFLRIVYAS